MPDWFYHTVSRPVLFRMPFGKARALACGVLGKIGGLPYGAGGAFIDFLGHMRPDERLGGITLGHRWIGPVGLGMNLDGMGTAAAAWTRFGFSFVEYGPVTETPRSSEGLAYDLASESIRYAALELSEPETLARRLQRVPRGPVHRIIRLRTETGAAPQKSAATLLGLVARLGPCAELFSVEFGGEGALPQWPEEEWRTFWRTLKSGSPWTEWLLAARAGGPECEQLLAAASGADGLILEAWEDIEGRRRVGPGAKPALVAALARVRESLGEAFPIIASGGVHQPADAREILGAGATLVQVDTGLVYSGPGLPKRINEAILSTRPPLEGEARRRPAKQSWFWCGAMGLGMLIGSILALWIAFTRVVMPYDETFCGITRSQLVEINDRLLPFMSHDRVTLAGTMIAIGLLYLNFSWFGSRRGEHWARTAVLASAVVGFASFFLFLGFGYFDPFHGFVTAVLFVLFVQGMVGDLPSRPPPPHPDWTETKEWRRAQWGQLLLVTHSVGLLGAGLVICAVGVGDVFVRTDLNYLQTDLDTLRAANPRLIPLVAHDRATLGGMLLASGVAYLLASLWGMRRRSAWLWHAFLWSGACAYVCAIGVHFWVGYLDWEHLLPAYTGLAFLLAGLGLCRAWMCDAAEKPGLSGRCSQGRG